MSNESIWEILFTKGPEWTPAKQPDKTVSKVFDDYRGQGNFWQILINANPEPKTMKPEQWGEIEVEPFYIYVFWNGWLAGRFNPAGGEMVAGEGANINALIESLRKTK